MGEYPLFEKSFQNYSVFYYFEGYGLYEDTDFTLRVSKTGKLYLNTAKLNHHHDASGRPNQYQYGKMVVRGWYVWPKSKPSFKHQFKWHAITILLTVIRFTNVFTCVSKKSLLPKLWENRRLVELLLNKPK
jgi:GT2 family glycosyltransferase